MFRKLALLALLTLGVMSNASAFYHITGSSSVASTILIGNGGGGDSPIFLGYKVICTNTSIAGSVSVTISWTDPYVGAQSVTLGPLSLLTLGGSQYTVIPLNQASGTNVYYTITTFGVVGSPTYDLQFLYIGAG